MIPGKSTSPVFIRRTRFRRISSLTEMMAAPDPLQPPTVLISFSSRPGPRSGILFPFLLLGGGPLLPFGKPEGHDLPRHDVRGELVDHDLDVVGGDLLHDAHPGLRVLGHPDFDFAVDEFS